MHIFFQAAIQFIIAMIATMGFAILYDTPKKELIYAGITGAIGWSAYFVIKNDFFMSNAFANVIAVFSLTLLSRILAVLRRCPVTVYLLVGIFPLVPGMGIYYTAYYLIMRNDDLFASNAISTFETAACLAFGIALGFSLPQKWFNLFWGNK